MTLNQYSKYVWRAAQLKRKGYERLDQSIRAYEQRPTTARALNRLATDAIVESYQIVNQIEAILCNNR